MACLSSLVRIGHAVDLVSEESLELPLAYVLIQFAPMRIAGDVYGLISLLYATLPSTRVLAKAGTASPL
jgi:hypothetical protein